MHTSWVVKYRPKHLADIAGNKDAISALTGWIESWKKKPPAKRAALLYGLAGTGKTVSVEAAARDLNLDLVEINASDRRSGEAIRQVAGMATRQAGLFNGRRIVLLDEIDGINLAEDSGAIAAVVEIIRTTHSPVLLTANDPWEPKIRPLRELCMLIQFKRLTVRDSLPYLKELCEAEKIDADEKALKFIIERNEGDMRSIVNDLQMLSAGKSRLGYEDVTWLAWRDRKESVFGALKVVFTAKNCLWARKAIDLADVDYEMLFEWIYQNAPHQLSDKRDLADAMNALAKADLYLARAKRSQAWGLLSYVFDLMTAGVAMSREHTKPAFVPMKFPERITILSLTRRGRALRAKIGAKIGAKCHVSSRSALEFIPYLQFIFKSNPGESAKIAAWLELDEDDVPYVAGSEKLAVTITKSSAK